jgi:predicted amidohydrolase YtcJ
VERLPAASVERAARGTRSLAFVTHEYTILTGGIVLAAPELAEAPDVASLPTAIAWAEDTVLAVGSDREVRAVSRGDSRFHDLGGAIVRPLVPGMRLEPGAMADFEVLERGPGTAGSRRRRLAVVRAGHVVDGGLP